MIPLRITVQGFMCYRDRQTVDFAGASLWVLAGENGSGKSTLFDAMTVALYGEHRAGKQHLGDLINHHADAFDVEFDFEFEGQAFRVKRTQPRRGSGTRAAFTIARDGREQPIGGTTSRDGFNRWRDELIGLNLKAFTSCVVLLQGKADALINAEPADRMLILSNLIDLSRYQRMHERVDSKRRQLVSDARQLSVQLNAMPRITDADQNAAQDAAEIAYEHLQATLAEMNRLTTLETQCQHHKEIAGQIANVLRRQHDAQELLTRSDEIGRGVQRWQALQAATPRLAMILDTRNRLQTSASNMRMLEATLLQERDAEAEAVEGLSTATTAATDLEARMTDLRAERETLNDQLHVHRMLSDRLDGIEKHEQNRRDLLQVLRAFPADLDEQLDTAERGIAELARLKEIYPALVHLHANRDRLPSLVDEHTRATDSRRAAEQQIAASTADAESAHQQVKHADRAEREANNALQQGRASHDAAASAIDAFNQAADAPECSVCGQPITPEHAERERARLRERADQAHAALADLTTRHAEANDALVAAKRASGEADTNLQRAVNALHLAERNLDNATLTLERAMEDLHRAWDQLSEDMRVQVSPDQTAPSTSAAWMATSWPTPATLAVLASELTDLDHLNRTLTILLHEQKRQIVEQTRYDQICQQLVAMTDGFDREAAYRSRDELPALEKRSAALRTEIDGLATDIGTTRTERERCQNVLDTARASRHDTEAMLRSEQATQNEVESVLNRELSQLEESWVPVAQQLTSDKLNALCAEQQHLAGYPPQADELLKAGASLNELAIQLGQLNDQIAALPAEAHQRLETVTTQLEAARESHRRANSENIARANELNDLTARRDRYDALARQERSTQKEARLHSRLADLLGRRGLQMAIVRRVEVGVVHEANVILDRLSGGRMRLELRHEGGQTDSALDLLYHDDETATRPMAIGLASGSQRFRIAVSLSLAIGRYLGNESQRVQSVIIDEGFGSLDKSGRGDMIEVLGELQSELRRIILVSHQEEIADAFPHCYRTQLVNGAATVDLAHMG